ncbi:MAG: HAD family hydrolase [Deltaproteobacteria bacterium]|nr:MAG: HAD family hydrolase [Deltaproteobacteria bacterium]
MQKEAIADKFNGFILDLDGTVYLSDNLIPNADKVIHYLREKGKKVKFLSNKPIETRINYANKLTRLGIPTKKEDVINSSYVLVEYLKKKMPSAKLYIVGEPPLIEEVKEAGFVITENPDEIDLVVAAFDRTFDYKKLNIAYQAIKRGAHFWATNPDRTCPVEGGEIPDCAGMIGAIEGVTGKTVELIVGKPSPIMVEVILSHMRLSPDQCIMVGDRLETDMVMGKNSKIATALVLTGITKREDLEKSKVKPDYVLESIADLIKPEIL